MCTENLNPNILVMKAAKDRARTDDSSSLNRARERRIFVQCTMRSDFIVITSIGSQDAAQMFLAQDDTSTDMNSRLPMPIAIQSAPNGIMPGAMSARISRPNQQVCDRLRARSQRMGMFPE